MQLVWILMNHHLFSPTPNIGDSGISIATAAQPSSTADNATNETLYVLIMLKSGFFISIDNM